MKEEQKNNEKKIQLCTFDTVQMFLLETRALNLWSSKNEMNEWRKK